ncbi:MAG: hypothetical protein JWM28_876 [Chitinophagaceae bacterium]|nr:hypothetical protein [Chitinophagaceae bacterium]
MARHYCRIFIHHYSSDRKITIQKRMNKNQEDDQQLSIFSFRKKRKKIVNTFFVRSC